MIGPDAAIPPAAPRRARSVDRPLEVDCQPRGTGWRCSVTVGDDPSATRHDVEVSAATLRALAPAAGDPVELVRASFEFLLAREPRESILRTFELPLIGRYFADWEDEITERLR
jgi:hypothetical protein